MIILKGSFSPQAISTDFVPVLHTLALRGNFERKCTKLCTLKALRCAHHILFESPIINTPHCILGNRCSAFSRSPVPRLRYPQT